MTLTLFSKPGCHLCDEVREHLDGLQPEHGFALLEVDITGDPAVFARYRDAIPVVWRDGVEVARGRITDRELKALLIP